ncbi:uncharacterized protein LOC119591253 [Penaeus monodon]|uniref:uncharacterized protein LOC119591253 n=1 Tax=Penaeus monodon TaxID=6687 RepID=UPI0018A6FC91|nr:uncharacterized protein LOC119591253 [Penaeus monodon]XP_037795893.1 uncharacterized protein LOC119591253 [Penaeus monodon]
MKPALTLCLAAILAISAVVEARLSICSSTAECPPRHQCVRNKCSDKCNTMSDCRPGLGCILGRCKDLCEGACGKAAICNVILNEAVCVCPGGHAGNPLEECVPALGRIPCCNRTPEPPTQTNNTGSEDESEVH